MSYTHNRQRSRSLLGLFGAAAALGSFGGIGGFGNMFGFGGFSGFSSGGYPAPQTRDLPVDHDWYIKRAEDRRAKRRIKRIVQEVLTEQGRHRAAEKAYGNRPYPVCPDCDTQSAMSIRWYGWQCPECERKRDWKFQPFAQDAIDELRHQTAAADNAALTFNGTPRPPKGEHCRHCNGFGKTEEFDPSGIARSGIMLLPCRPCHGFGTRAGTPWIA